MRGLPSGTALKGLRRTYCFVHPEVRSNSQGSGKTLPARTPHQPVLNPPRAAQAALRLKVLQRLQSTYPDMRRPDGQTRNIPGCLAAKHAHPPRHPAPHPPLDPHPHTPYTPPVRGLMTHRARFLFAATLALFCKPGRTDRTIKARGISGGVTLQSSDPVEDQKLCRCITSGKTLQTKDMR